MKKKNWSIPTEGWNLTKKGQLFHYTLMRIKTSTVSGIAMMYNPYMDKNYYDKYNSAYQKLTQEQKDKLK